MTNGPHAVSTIESNKQTEPDTIPKTRVALTFESGGDPIVSDQMLDMLTKEDVRVTIFLLGSWAEQNPTLVKRMVAEGHELGNHSYSHPDLTSLEDHQIRQELFRTNEFAENLTGKQAFPWLRPPFGAVDERLRQVVAAEGYRLVLRDAVDGGHWPGESTPERINQRTLENVYDGAVLAYHINSPMTLQVLGDVIRNLRAANCELVRLSELPEVRERPERRPECAELNFEPGYLQVMKPTTHVWSMNVLEYGTRKTFPANLPVQLTDTNNYSINLIAGGTSEQMLPASPSDRHLLLIHGAVEYQFRTVNDTQIRLRHVGRSGDLVLWPDNCELLITGTNGQWLLLILG